MASYPEIGDFSPRSGVTFRVINPEIGDRSTRKLVAIAAPDPGRG